MTYRVATAPDGGKLWWSEHDTIPPDHTNIRLATQEETVVMNKIVRHPNPPVSMGRTIAKLMDAAVPGAEA